jgi:ribonucleoside-diphosphate reductase beta chain
MLLKVRIAPNVCPVLCDPLALIIPEPLTSVGGFGLCKERTTMVKAINWNNVPEFEKTIWNKLTENFWLPEKIPLSNDLQSWGKMSEQEKATTIKVFAGLTFLDTIQGTTGAIALMKDAGNPFEEAIYANMCFMEVVHAKSYSSIFSTLCSTKEIDEVFRWTEENENLQFKANEVLKYYRGSDPMKKKIASTMLEGFLFYSGFYLPLYWSSRQKLTNTADLIRLILRDEGVHSYMIGQWYQRDLANYSLSEQEEYKQFTYDLLFDLYENETEYTQDLYDDLGLTEDVKKFLHYNANKSLMNLGYDPMFPKDQTDVSAAILSSLSTNSGENHDFFSGSGSSYIIGKVVKSTDDDWDF